MRYSLILILTILVIACGNSDQTSEVEQTSNTTADTTRTVVDGIDEVRDEKGNLIMRGERVNGQREGGWESYFPNGTLRSKGTFVNGVREGPTTVYHENGNIFYTGWYRNGTPSGEWTFHDPDGTARKIARYSDEGILLEEREVDPATR